MKIQILSALFLGLFLVLGIRADPPQGVQVVAGVERTGVYPDGYYAGMRGVVVRAVVQNVSTQEIGLSYMTCSWYDMWSIRGSNDISCVTWDCLGNFPAKMKLGPGQCFVFYIPMVMRNDVVWNPGAAISIAFRCVEWRQGLASECEIPDAGTNVWSNEIVLGMLGSHVLRAYGDIEAAGQIEGRAEGGRK